MMQDIVLNVVIPGEQLINKGTGGNFSIEIRFLLISIYYFNSGMLQLWDQPKYPSL